MSRRSCCWARRFSGRFSSVMSNSRRSSLPEAMSRWASAGMTSVRPSRISLRTGIPARPFAGRKPTIRPLASTDTRSPVISVSWCATSAEGPEAAGPAAALRTGWAAAGVVMPAASATAAAAATAGTPTLFTCLCNSPPGE
ncbi:hypothetical protein SMICM17S_05074 [Streptomyces microflavus]